MQLIWPLASFGQVFRGIVCIVTPVLWEQQTAASTPSSLLASDVVCEASTWPSGTISGM